MQLRHIHSGAVYIFYKSYQSGSVTNDEVGTGRPYSCITCKIALIFSLYVIMVHSSCSVLEDVVGTKCHVIPISTVYLPIFTTTQGRTVERNRSCINIQNV